MSNPALAQDCKGGGKDFPNRSLLLMHLSVAHFSEQLLAWHPFSKDTQCTLCLQDNRAKVPLTFLFLLVVYLCVFL